MTIGKACNACLACMENTPLVLRENTHNGLFTQVEYMNCALILNGLSLRLCLIYRPLPSKKNDLSNAKFLLEWEAFLDKPLTIHQDVTISGDLIFRLKTRMAIFLKGF